MSGATCNPILPYVVLAVVTIVVVAIAAMIGVLRALDLLVLVLAVVTLPHSLKPCLNCHLLPGKEYTVANCKKYDEPSESKESLASAGVLSPSTLYTIGIEDTNGDVNCRAACILRLRHNCSEPGRIMCTPDLCTPAKPAVAFEDLAEGEYTVPVNCEESKTSCYAEPQEFSFHVQQQSPNTGNSSKEIQLSNIKLYKKVTGRCSHLQVSRSRHMCFQVLLILVSVVIVVLLLLRNELRKRNADEITQPPILEDIKMGVAYKAYVVRTLLSCTFCSRTVQGHALAM